MPPLLARAFGALADQARRDLVAGSQPGAQPSGSQPAPADNRPLVFQAVSISLPLAPPMILHTPGTGSGQGDKNIVGVPGLLQGGNKCVVYGLGIADDPGFEQQMASTGCEVHAFDCTVNPNDKELVGKSFKFHHWCIGDPKAPSARHLNESIYSKIHGSEGHSLLALKNKQNKTPGSLLDGQHLLNSSSHLQFKTLSDTMKELGHSSLDLLKFDIEGYEWDLFKTQLLAGQTLPEQISFELHTREASRAYVPHELVGDKGYAEVNSLFLQLHDKGYRVASKELNSGDPACCEFVLVKML